MYFLQPANRLKNLVHAALTLYFGNKANISIDSYGHLTVKVLSGYEEERAPVPEDPDIIGGGIKQSMNGLTFQIIIREVPDATPQT